jgi:hypothetical protein
VPRSEVEAIISIKQRGSFVVDRLIRTKELRGERSRVDLRLKVNIILIYVLNITVRI